MKLFFSNLLLLAFCFLFINDVKAQKNIDESAEYFINFEGNDYNMLEFDTTGIWQVGVPAKADWDSAFNGTHVLMTDTLNMLDKPAKAWVMFKWDRPWWSNCIAAWYIGVKHKYDFPEHKAGGYIEVSYNKGNTWHNIVNDTLYDNVAGYEDYFGDTLLNGEYAATGKKTTWGVNNIICSKLLYPDSIAAKVHSVWFRFVYKNLDTISHKGWMIDRLSIKIGHNCEFIDIQEIDNSQTLFYPNPLTENSILEFSNPANEEFLFEVVDITGRVILKQDLCDNIINLKRSQFTKGYYIYRLTNNKDKTYKGKFFVE